MNKKILLVSGLIVLLGGFAIFEKFIANQQTTTQLIGTKQGNVNPSAQVNPTVATPSTVATAGFKDGTYKGSVVNSMYGPAQAQVTIVNGKITDVAFLQYPNDRAASLSKSKMAMPIIKQEVIQSQSANVNTVSGATETSSSFVQSVSLALSQAS